MSSESVCKGSACDRHPQPCIDFCDAAAYCEAIGKHLCGGIGGAAIDMSGAEDPDKSQWQHACTSGGAHAFYTGDSISVGKCNDGTANSPSTREVGGKADCQSPEADFAGVFDLIGNVWEWEDNCRGSSGEGDVCNPRGGSFGISAAAPQCAQQLPASRAQKADNIGFRCCTG
jgi:formylglycine-generating enzyme required for sulfatase activity